jgi:uncharacterized protein (TIGR02680 family)
MTTNAKPRPEKARWTLLRAGLQNIWEYDSQVFVCHRGRLLLRGRNESGKTKALEVLFPFLLDADLSPQRLDPFETKARQMRFNLIHDGNPEVGVSIGYVWMEFGRRRGEGDEYFTIGAGLRAMRSNGDVTPWYFTASCRVGVDFNLLADTREPLTRRALEESLMGRGHVWERERRSDYRRAVQKTLFDLPDDQYTALVNTLILLRRPQLSNKFDLLELSKILTASLPPLDEGVIRPIAEGFERLDQHRAEKDAVKRNLKEVQVFERIYRDYLRGEAKAAAQALTSTESAFHKARETLKKAIEQREVDERKREGIAQRILELELEDTQLGSRLDALKSSEEYKAVEAIARAEAEVGTQHSRVRSVEGVLTEERGSLKIREERCRRTSGKLEQLRQEAERERTSARRAAQLADLETEHGVMETKPSKAALEAVVSARQAGIAAVEKEAVKVLQAESEAKLKRGLLAKAEADLAEALGRVDAAGKDEEEARSEFLEKLDAWRVGTRILGPIDLPSVDDDLHRIPSLVREAALAKHGELGAKLEGAAAALKTAEEEVEHLSKEKDRLAREPHRRPPAPVWRAERDADRPGAPFYLLCEFTEKDATLQAGLEGALESAGLLDAWVTPEGNALDPRTQDVLIEAAPVEGRTLRDYMKPVGRDGVSEARMDRLLRSVAVASHAEAGGRCWVATNGCWANGVLRGAWTKPVAAYIGESARQGERERRRIEIEKLLTLGEQKRAQAASRRDGVRDDVKALDAEVDALPSLSDVQHAAHLRIAAEDEAGRKRAKHDEAVGSLAKAEKQLSDAKARRDKAAVEHHLTTWVDRLQELRILVSAYYAAAREAIQAAEKEAESRDALVLAEEDRADSERKVDARALELEIAIKELEKLQAWAKGLRDKAGATREALVLDVRKIEARVRTAREEITGHRKELRDADVNAGAAKKAVETAQQTETEADSRRKSAEGAFKDFATEGLLEAAGLKATLAAVEWSSRDALHEARRVDAETKAVGADQKTREGLQNKVTGRQNELQQALPPEIKVTPTYERGIWRYPFHFNGRPLAPAELVESLHRDVEERERRLGEDERDLLEKFLSGEARQHLQDRLRGAHDLVDAMNVQIEACPTASGTRVRLKWEPAADAAPGTRKAIELLFKSAELLTEADRKAIKDFLQDRLDQARGSTEQEKSLVLRMSDILDYRKWHTFAVLYKEGAGDWKPLTSKAHAAGSGGKKAMILHLPLFAAAAAFYGAPTRGSARLIALDEAFVGIDKKARGELMGLLKGFDLDFLMTSHEEWGFYKELDGLSTYHLSREPEYRGVLAERFVWDGKVAEQVDE